MIVNIKHIHNKLKHKYQNDPSQYNDMIINNLIKTRSCKLVTVIKECMIFDYSEEFLKRYYLVKESYDRIPKFVNYYKNYLKFFCRPTFRHSTLNDVVQHYGEVCAEMYYNKNYGKKSKKSKDKKEKNMNTKDNGVNNEKIFTDTVKGNINNISNSHRHKGHKYQTPIKKKNNFYNQTINNECSKETIKFGDDEEFNTLNTKSIIKDTSLLSILNAFNNNTNNVHSNIHTYHKIKPQQSNVMTNKVNMYTDKKTKLNISTPNTYALKAFATSTIQQQHHPRKNNLKLMSPTCVMMNTHLQGYNMNSNSNNVNNVNGVYNDSNLKYPILHSRAKTESQNIRLTAKPQKKRVISDLASNNNNNIVVTTTTTANTNVNAVAAELRNKKMFTTTSRNFIQRHKPVFTSFNHFDQQQQLLNNKNGKALPFLNSISSRNANVNSNSGNLFRTTMINNLNNTNKKILHHNTPSKLTNQKFSIYKGRNKKITKYSLNTKLKLG